jgi:hypothetical protein
MQSVSLPSPLSNNNHTQAASSCQYYDSHLAYYYSNQMNNYEMNPSSLVLDASTAYKWQEQQAETYSKHPLSMIASDIKTEGNPMVDTANVGANEFSSQIDRTHNIHSNNMLMVSTAFDEFFINRWALNCNANRYHSNVHITYSNYSFFFLCTFLVKGRAAMVF